MDFLRLEKKALYNLLRLNGIEGVEFEVDPRALSDFRSLSGEELFDFLRLEKVNISKEIFLQFAENCDTPEELTELLFPDSGLERNRDLFYLAVFELWRRYLPEKQSLSIFCDELDHRISLYDEGKLESDELIQDVLANLLDILDENADAGVGPEEVFQAICSYCAHDIESFIYHYISDLIDGQSDLYASELVDGFFPYISESNWFHFLKIRLNALSDIKAANMATKELLEEELDLPFLQEVIRFLATSGEHALFIQAVRKALVFIESQEELIDLLSMMADYYRLLDEDEKERAIEKMILHQKKGSVSPTDVKTLEQLLSLSE